MLAIARAITQRSVCKRRYVAVDARGATVLLWSPKGSRGVMTRCTRKLAEQLAVVIREGL